VEISRRTSLKSIGLGLGSILSSDLQASKNIENHLGLNGKINHSVCRWCYDDIPLEELCKAAVAIGIKSIELVDVKDFPILKKYGLECAMVSSINKTFTIEKGWNDPNNHEGLYQHYKYLIDETAKAGFKNVICFSGNRTEDINDELGLENCAEGLAGIMEYAEHKKVTLVMELLNSKIDHKGYMCDITDWGTELCQMIGSDNFKLLYDIYHMQIMEGDIIRTIQENKQYIAHFHTGGVPGRNEIDDTQELNYGRIMKAIVDTGYKGYVGQEFIPKRPDKIASLASAIKICDV
jgi:hydroxypyruvate isomerase